MLDGVMHDFERATGPWHLEWSAVPESFLLASSALHQANFMLRGLNVDAARMRRNLDLTGGLIVAEAVMMGLAPMIGRQQAHDIVYDACRAAIENGRTLYDELRRHPAITNALDDARLKFLTDPANYLGSASAMARAVVSATT
jgi:3-carboxy-cis,cis-muconate cycloisomerase